MGKGVPRVSDLLFSSLDICFTADWLFYCSCDEGYFGPFCVPSKALPQAQRDDFNHPPSSKTWIELYGAELSNICGTLVSGTALVFFKVFRFCGVYM